MNFAAKFGKSYATRTEYEQRFELFQRTLDVVKAHNDERYSLGINHLADATAEERSKLFGRVNWGTRGNN